MDTPVSAIQPADEDITQKAKRKAVELRVQTGAEITVRVFSVDYTTLNGVFERTVDYNSPGRRIVIPWDGCTYAY